MFVERRAIAFLQESDLLTGGDRFLYCFFYRSAIALLVLKSDR
ncbi:MAG: hypothetical protein ACFKPT_25005 [Gloeotrichia echinulata GP01]